jgi:hypothetical protein
MYAHQVRSEGFASTENLFPTLPVRTSVKGPSHRERPAMHLKIRHQHKQTTGSTLSQEQEPGLLRGQVDVEDEPGVVLKWGVSKSARSSLTVTRS